MKRILWLTTAVMLGICGCQSLSEAEISNASSDSIAESSSEASESSSQASSDISETSSESSESSEVIGSPEDEFDPYSIINTMTDEELIGQLFLARCPDYNTAIADIGKYNLGGFVLFANNVKNETPESLKSILSDYQSASKIPLLISVDEEGGTVVRVSKFSQFRSEPFPSPRSLYESGGLEMVLNNETEKCILLKDLGINVNLAPVCDVTTDKNAFMYKRSLGESPEKTGEYISAVVELMSGQQTGAVLKHFPGYGNNVDTHVGIAVDERSLEYLEENDLVPFKYGIQAGCDAIMISHTIVNCLDNELPASLSPKVMGYLRDDMGFNGIIMTDDLSMSAITARYGAGEAAVMAVKAGVDLLCSTEYRTQYDAVLEAYNKGELTHSQIEESVARILIWKHDLGLI